MSSMDTTAGNTSIGSLNDDSVSSGVTRTGASSTIKKHHQQNFAQSTPQRSAAAVAAATSANDDRDKNSFYRDLYHFHETKGTPIPRPPRINGQEIDLHKLYSIVCGRGGWAKINYRNEWEDLVTDFGMAAQCVNASVALKQIYMRYLDRYEKIHFLGEDNDRNTEENDDDNRHKKWSNKNFNEVPLKYNHAQHIVSDSVRALHKLSTDLYKPSEYDRLLLSLMSPLPNEQDFAINVCTLMANESKHTLKIEHCPKLLDALLGHAGIYSHFSMRELFLEFYSNIRKHSLQSFWNDCLQDKSDILEMSFDDYFQSPSDKLDDKGRPPVRLRPKDDEVFDDGLNVRAHEVDDYSSLDFLNLRRGLGTHDYIGQRVHQITSICRNLSFFEENVPTLVRNRTFIRFLVMCANIRWGNLHQMGLDMLGNVAIELDLCDPSGDDLSRCLLTTIADGLESPDRGVIISCLEILYKLCQKGTNDDYLHRYLDKKIYRQICLYLSLNDIMLLLYTLECLFALSSLGEKSCFAIVQIHGVIDTLVSLVSVEAQSYGPDGCILMRVVETVPTHMTGQYSHHHQHQQSNTLTPLQSSPQSSHHHQHGQSSVDTSPSTTAVGPFSPPEPPKPLTPVHGSPTTAGSYVGALPTPKPVVQPVAQPVPPPAPQPAPLSSPQPRPQPKPQPAPPPTPQPAPQPVAQPPSQPTQIITNGPSTPNAPSVAAPPVVPPMPTSTTASNYVYSEQQTTSIVHSSTNSNSTKQQQQANQENEQFALAWLRATFEPANVMNSRIEQQDLYKMYLTACSKVGRAGIVSTYHFPRCVQNVFGKTVGPNTLKIIHNNMESTSQFFEGIRIRAQPLAVVHKGTILQAAVTTTPVHVADNGKREFLNQPTIVKTSMGQHVQQTASPSPVSSATSAPILQQVLSNQTSGGENVVLISPNRPNIIQVNPSAPNTPSSLIKSLLANKVNADGSPIGPAPASVSTSIASPSNSLTVATNVNVQVAQRQHLLKQKEAQQMAAAAAKSHNAAIVGIKGPTLVERKVVDDAKSSWDPVPPLAPLSSGVVIHNNLRPGSIITAAPTISSPRIDEDSNSTNQSAGSSICGTNPTTPNCTDDVEGSFAGFEGLLIPGGSMKVYSDEDMKDLNKQSPVVSNNKMLADLLERKSADPPFSIQHSENTAKRKIDLNDTGEPSTKRVSITANETVVIDDDSNDGMSRSKASTTTSSNAANLYAKLAASLLEDEDMELDETINNQPSVVQSNQLLPPPPPPPPAIVEPAKSVITVPMQRQIIVSPNNPPQMILAPTPNNPSLGQATATIKTDAGYQTVPVILQHGSPNQMGGSIQYQKQMMQPVMQQPQTQYVLATNQQGQTYLLAQQPTPPPQPTQILLTQTSQQQGGTPTKTIIILQQQAGPNVQGAPHQAMAGAPQKMIMTTQQGQQMIVTQVPRPIQHHVIVNSHSPGNVIQTAPVISTAGSIINQVSSLSGHQQQPQIVSQIQLQQNQGQLSLPPPAPQINQPIIHVQKQNAVADKKVFVTGSGNIEVTEVTQKHQPHHHQQHSHQHQLQQQPQQQHQLVQQQQQQHRPQLLQQHQKPPQLQSPPPPQQQPQPQQQKSQIATPPPPPPTPATPPAAPKVDDDSEWLFICDWRGCQRKKFRSAHEVYMHACAIHVPDSIDINAEIYCQWGPGPNLCDNLPRKRFSLMTHINDRHCSLDSLKASVQRRLAAGPQSNQPTQPVTIIKNPQMAATPTGTASPAPSTSSAGSLNTSSSSAAMQAIKRHTLDLVNPKELMAKDENEGPVTKSIRLTAALILRNLVNYTAAAKRCLRYYEPHLSSIALSNVESSRTIAQVLFEMNETRPY